MQKLLLRTNIKKHYKYVVAFIPALLVCLFSLISLKPTHLVMHQNNINAKTFVESKGNSKIISETVSPKRLYSKYKIGLEEHPRLGIGIIKDKENSYINIKNKDYLDIKLNPDSTDKFNLCLLFDIPDFTLKEQWWTYRYLISEVTVLPNKKRYRIPINDLHTPTWWYSVNRISRDAIFENFKLSRCKVITFTNHDLAPRGTPLEIDIRKISLSNNPIPIIRNMFLFLFIYILFFYLLFFRNVKSTAIAYEKLPINNNIDMEYSELSNFLGANYHKTDISQANVIKKTGIPAHKIRQILKKHHSWTFKQHLTHLRVSEAKRLLKETDRQIVEISLCVGYKHISTFNHIFKNETGLTPKEFREKS